NTIMFREEIEDLKNRHMGRLSVIHVLESDAQDIDLFQGRVDQQKCADLFAHWIDVTAVDTAFICGPEPMMRAISAALSAHGLSDDQIKYELFAAAQPGRLARPATAATGGDPAQQFQATVTLDGAARTVQLDAQTTILQAALDNALDAPYACRAGVCSTCKCKVTEGEVEMVANHALEDHEVAQGYVLSCQSFPLTPRVAVDYDQH
ncbi:MAG: 2Fe-2S iron-sulfur cluster-binding protein, partial [Pseudomonadota bacterium]